MKAIETTDDQTLVSFSKWLNGLGRSDTTGWRWVQLGWLQDPVNISGRLFLTRENIAQFNRRAAAGEFAKQPHGAAKESAADRAAKSQTA